MLAVVLASCGGTNKAPATAQLIVGQEPTPDSEEVAAVPDAACVAECRGRYEGSDGVEGYVGFCDELCSPPTEASQQCVMSCEKSHEPGAHYDDNGEYVEDEDTRDEAQVKADREGCEEECATVPTLSNEAMNACVTACSADGHPEPICQAACDPDPYDQCRYQPCD